MTIAKDLREDARGLEFAFGVHPGVSQSLHGMGAESHYLLEISAKVKQVTGRYFKAYSFPDQSILVDPYALTCDRIYNNYRISKPDGYGLVPYTFALTQYTDISQFEITDPKKQHEFYKIVKIPSNLVHRNAFTYAVGYRDILRAKQTIRIPAGDYTRQQLRAFLAELDASE